MRIGIDYVEQAYNADGSEDGYNNPRSGWTPAYNFGGFAQDDDPANMIKVGDYVHGKGNFEKPPVVNTVENMACKTKKETGKKISFRSQAPDGTEVWRMVMGREQQGGGFNNSRAGNPYNGGGQRPATSGTPQRPQAPHGAGNAPQAHSKPVPTMAQAVAVLKECVEAVAGWGEHSHATTLFLGRLRGDIAPNPSAAQIEAARAAELQKAQDEIDAAQARAAKLKADAEAKKAGPAGYEPAPPPAPLTEDEIPW